MALRSTKRLTTPGPAYALALALAGQVRGYAPWRHLQAWLSTSLAAGAPSTASVHNQPLHDVRPRAVNKDLRCEGAD